MKTCKLCLSWFFCSSTLDWSQSPPLHSPWTVTRLHWTILVFDLSFAKISAISITSLRERAEDVVVECVPSQYHCARDSTGYLFRQSANVLLLYLNIESSFFKDVLYKTFLSFLFCFYLLCFCLVHAVLVFVG